MMKIKYLLVYVHNSYKCFHKKIKKKEFVPFLKHQILISITKEDQSKHYQICVYTKMFDNMTS